MRLDYGTITSPYPIVLTIGTVRKPTIGEIADSRVLGFETFGLYESFLLMTPEVYYTQIDKQHGLSDDEIRSMTIYDAIVQDENLQKIYTDLLQFFFEENVVFHAGFFVLLNSGVKPDHDLTREDVRGVITKESFQDVINILKQICGMQADEDEPDISKMKFKNETARKLFEKMQRAKKAESKTRKHDANMTLPNIISAVCSRHPSINYTNVYQLTVYQLMDSFDRLRNDAYYEIDKTRVAVWGDEKKTFKHDLWYKNEYDKK